uniref:(northern house mosquito) hypothetical protein n=1 Tax=Culex pipiens TaxID=7175 RepID=A0A8D8BVF7_CULPI
MVGARPGGGTRFRPRARVFVCVDITGTVILESRGSSSAVCCAFFLLVWRKLFRSDSVLLLLLLLMWFHSIFMPCWLPPPPKGRRGAILLRELRSGVGHKSSSTRSRHRRGHRPHSVDPGVQDSYSIYDKTPHFTLQFKCEEPYICT